MKGIILAGGGGSRPYPITRGISKQLLPVYDNPMIYYPLSVLMLAGIRDILIITTPEEMPLFKRLLDAGEAFGIRLTYAAQLSPEGMAQAFLIGESLIGDDRCYLVLGDNIYFSQRISPKLRQVAAREHGATLFAYQMMDPEPFGVAAFDDDFRAVAIEKKPAHPRSLWR